MTDGERELRVVALSDEVVMHAHHLILRLCSVARAHKSA